MTVVQHNYLKLLEQINSYAVKYGRNPEEITLVVISKGHPWEIVEPLEKLGCSHFGENRIQEALPKIEQAPPYLNWHFVGPLQSNKARKAVGVFSLIHSIDSYILAKKISIISGENSLTTAILLQVNTSGEQSKQGMTIEECLEKYRDFADLPHLKIEGLMTIAPNTEDQKVIGDCFSKLRVLKEKLGLKHLSMGMSNDFPIAIAEGATLLRIGSKIFA